MGITVQGRHFMGDAVIIDGERVPLRLLKDHSVTHAVAHVVVQMGYWNAVRKTVTVCRGESDVPWGRTSRFRPSGIDCMGCLVSLSQM